MKKVEGTNVEVEITVRVRNAEGKPQGAAVRRQIQHSGYAGEKLRRRISSGLVLEATQRLHEILKADFHENPKAT